MKYILAIAIALTMISSALAWDHSGSRGWNYLDQTNTVYGDTGYDVDPAGWFWADIENGDVTQEASNCAAIMGSSNDVEQTNTVTAKGILIDQISKNALMVIGTRNDVVQANTAYAGGITQVDGSNIDQTQKNMLLVLGHSNDAYQSNDAYALNDIDPDKGYYIDQTEKNIAAMIGKKNDLDQINDVDGFMRKCIEVDPVLDQNAKNLAFMVGMGACYDGEECEHEAISYAAPEYEWPEISAEKVTIPKVTCDGCFELEECIDPDGNPTPCE